MINQRRVARELEVPESWLRMLTDRGLLSRYWNHDLYVARVRLIRAGRAVGIDAQTIDLALSIGGF